MVGSQREQCQRCGYIGQAGEGCKNCAKPLMQPYGGPSGEPLRCNDRPISGCNGGCPDCSPWIAYLYERLA